MKTTLLTIFFALAAFMCHAQLSKGSIVIAGAAGLNKSELHETLNAKSSTTNKEYLFLNSSAGYMIIDKLELGFLLEHTLVQIEEIEDISIPASEVSSTLRKNAYGLFARKYFMIADKFAITGRLSSGFAYATTDYDNTTPDKKENSFYVHLVPGVTYFATPKLGLTLNMGIYSFDKITYESDKDPNKPVGTNFNLVLNGSTLRLGLAYHFGK